MDINDTLGRTAAAQQGLVTSTQLKRCGYTRVQWRSAVANGRISQLRRGVFLVTPTPLSPWQQQVRAALLSIHDRGAASHLSAARLHGLREDDAIHVSVREPFQPRPKHVRIHRCHDLSPRDLTVIDGIVTTTAPRTLVDLGLVLPPTEVQRHLEHAVALGLVAEGKVHEVRIRVGERGRSGAGIIDRALKELPTGAHLAESGPEVRLLQRIVTVGLPSPVQQHQVHLPNGTRCRLDLAYPDQRIALEYDGAEWHSTRAQVRRDQRRQRSLEAAGWTVLRFGHDDLAPGTWKLAATIERALLGAGHPDVLSLLA